MPFYKKLLNKKLVLQDIEYVDPEMFQSLAWIRYENDCESNHQADHLSRK